MSAEIVIGLDGKCRISEVPEPRRMSTALERFTAACPDGKVPFVVTLRDLDDFDAGDVVLGHRPDNGLRGRLRVRAGVVVGRYIDTEDQP